MLASYGVVALRTDAIDAVSLRALHLRVVMRNDDVRAWRFDVREQRIELQGRSPSSAAFSSASPGTPPPDMTIDPATTRVVDLFFPLPVDLQTASEIPAFDAIASLGVGARVYVARVSSKRLVADPLQFIAADYGKDHWGPPFSYNASCPDIMPADLIAKTITIHVAPDVHVTP